MDYTNRKTVKATLQEKDWKELKDLWMRERFNPIILEGGIPMKMEYDMFIGILIKEAIDNRKNK